MQEEDWRRAKCDPYPNAYGWVLKNVRQITPFPVRGSLGLFNVEMKA
jgi:hypothetical protein